MEKKPKNDVGLALTFRLQETGPLHDFVEITSVNIRKVMCIGRIIYHIKTEVGHDKKLRASTRRNTLLSVFVIKPRFTKGWWNVPYFPWEIKHPYINGRTHQNVLFDKDWSETEWIDHHKVMHFDRNGDYYGKWRISHYIRIQEKNSGLYYRPHDEILQFIKN